MRGFGTEIANMLCSQDTKNANYTLLIKDIDTIAVQLKKLQDNGVPVLWRPLHEAEGKWFWVSFPIFSSPHTHYHPPPPSLSIFAIAITTSTNPSPNSGEPRAPSPPRNCTNSSSTD